MTTVMWWFMVRRWQFKMWTRELNKDEGLNLLETALNTNIGSCRDHPAIYRDMQRILLIRK